MKKIINNVITNKKITTHINSFILLVCLVLILRWSNFQFIVALPIYIKDFFIKPTQINPIILSLVTGYISGLFIYFLTVIIPNHRKRAAIDEDIYNTLKYFYERNVYILLLMCKTTCKKEEWEELKIHLVDKNIINSDIDILDESEFQNKLKKFDIQTTADTNLLHKETKEKLSWVEYLVEDISSSIKLIDDIYINYNYNISEKYIEILRAIKYNDYLCMYKKISFNFDIVNEDLEGYFYYDNIPFIETFDVSKKRSKLFSKDNSAVLEDYIDLLVKIYNLLKKESINVTYEEMKKKNLEKQHKLLIKNKSSNILFDEDKKIGHFKSSLYEEQDK